MPADSEGTRFNTKQKKIKKGAQAPNKREKKEKEITWKDSEDNQARQSRKTIKKDHFVLSSCQSKTNVDHRQRTP